MKRLLWLSSNGSWIYNYLCNQCPSLLKVVSSNQAHGEVYSIQHYVIKFVGDFQVRGFLWVLQFSPPIKLTYITEILLKVALNTIILISLTLK
jgi:hypothetical protein